MLMNTERIIRNLAQSVLETMGFSPIVEVSSLSDENPGEFLCQITVSSDSNLLIGQHGVNLQSLQHIIRLLVKKEIGENVRISVDINAYWQQKSQAIAQKAREAAERAIRDHSPVFLSPMSGQERKFVHTELATNAQVVTESVGEGQERKVVIKPASLL